MSLTLESARFDNINLGVGGARTEDGQVLSILFTGLEVSSPPDDQDAAPRTVRADGLVQCQGRGWVSIHVRGGSQLSGARGLAHVMVWANGRRIALLPDAPGAADAPDEPMAGATTALVQGDGELRLSLTLLAQRDLGIPGSAAMCWVDSIDLQVISPPVRRPGSLGR